MVGLNINNFMSKEKQFIKKYFMKYYKYYVNLLNKKFIYRHLAFDDKNVWALRFTLNRYFEHRSTKVMNIAELIDKDYYA